MGSSDTTGQPSPKVRPKQRPSGTAPPPSSSCSSPIAEDLVGGPVGVKSTRPHRCFPWLPKFVRRLPPCRISASQVADKCHYQQFIPSRFLEVLHPGNPARVWRLLLHFAPPVPGVSESAGPTGGCGAQRRGQCRPRPRMGLRQELQGRQQPVVPTATTQRRDTGHNNNRNPGQNSTRGREIC